MTIVIFLFLATALLAFSNGANDNFKGVATLFGSNTTAYRGALWWATVTTFAGSVCSLFWAAGLVARFSGKGLVPDALAGTPDFAVAVALGAGLTVLAATLMGLPISTTHSLTGALLGGGLAAAGGAVQVRALGASFLLPLLASPLMAVGLAALCYPVLRRLRHAIGITEEWCVCVDAHEAPAPQPVGAATLHRIGTRAPSVTVQQPCAPEGTGRILGISSRQFLDGAHYLSAGLVSFARGLNDTPKIVALLVVVETLHVSHGMMGVAVAMAIGGLLKARRVAETMSRNITTLNPGQGFTANVITGLLVIGASRLGLPVSTTHVSVGAISGISLATGHINRRVLTEIGAAWVLTLPTAALCAAAAYALLHR